MNVELCRHGQANGDVYYCDRHILFSSINNHLAFKRGDMHGVVSRRGPVTFRGRREHCFSCTVKRFGPHIVGNGSSRTAKGLGIA